MAAVTASPTTHYDFFSTTLKQSMTSASQTSGIKLNAIKDNDGNARTLTTTSVILRFSRGGKQELISAGGWTQDANGVFTLTDVRRDLNTDDPTSFASGSDGIKWPAGTRVECVIDGRTIGKLARLDGANTFTATQTFTGQVDMDGGFKQPVYANTTARDAFYTSPEEGDECVVTGTGKQTYVGGAWVTTNAAATGFASTTVQGTVEIGAGADMAASTDTGGSGAKVVVPTSLVVKTSSGAGDENKVPCLGSDGKLASGFIPAAIDGVPVGSMSIWPTDTAPTSWLLCYGQAVSRTTYATLFAVISTTFGVGDGSTTFNLPDLRGRYALGQDDMGGSAANRVTDSAADTLGGTGGTADGSHTHTVNPDDYGIDTNGGGTEYYGFDDNGNQTSGSTSILPPYITLNYIIYAAA